MSAVPALASPRSASGVAAPGERLPLIGPLAPVLRDGLRQGLTPYAWGALLIAITNALSLTVPWILRAGVDGLRSGLDPRQIGRYAILMCAVAAVQAATRTASRVVIHDYGRRAIAELRERLHAHLLALPATFYDRSRVGDLMSRAVNDFRALRMLFGPAMVTLLNAILTAVAAVSMMLWLDPWLTLVALLAYPPFILLSKRSVRRTVERSRLAQERLSELTAGVEQSAAGHMQIKAFSQEEREMDAFAARSDACRLASLELARARARMSPLLELLGGLGALAVLGVGGWQVVRGAMTPGDFVAFTVLIGLLSGPAITLGWTLDVLQRGQAAAWRVQEILDEAPVGEDASAPAASAGAHEAVAAQLAAAPPVSDIQPWPAPPPPPSPAPIEARGLTFRHAGSDRGAALEGIDLSIAPGEHVGLIGPVGAGKSTLLALMAGIYPPGSGSVELAGQPLEALPTETLRQAIVLAPQEAFLFSSSLADNVRLGAPDLDDAAIEEWLRSVTFEADLARMPDGVRTWVGERGLTLSGGQRQRVALARALAPATPVVLLDDPLSMVDTGTEDIILERVLPMLRGRTLVVSSHRDGLLRRMDRLVRIENGRVTASGKPADLLGPEDGRP